MNKTELLNELNNLFTNNYNVILIDGPWGSGKTYLINEFIKENKDKKIFYVSLLGKKNVDDINTSLFSDVNKDNDNLRNIVALIPSAINALNNVNKENNLDFVLKINTNSNILVILDDLERYASSDYDSLLSYISNLVLKGAKVICITNLDALGSGELYNFNLYKEKIFDKVYKAELFNTELIKLKFKEYYDYLCPNTINLFKNNYRLVDKTYNFIKDINLKIDNIFETFSVDTKKEIIYLIALFLSIYFKNVPIRYEKLAKVSDFKERDYIKNTSSINESDKWAIIEVYDYYLNYKNLELFNDKKYIDFFIALYIAYVYATFDLLKLFLTKI